MTNFYLFISLYIGDISCNYILDFLEESADLMPQFNSSTCIIFDEDKFKSNDMSKANIDQVKQFCDPREVRRI